MGSVVVNVTGLAAEVAKNGIVGIDADASRAIAKKYGMKFVPKSLFGDFVSGKGRFQEETWTQLKEQLEAKGLARTGNGGCVIVKADTIKKATKAAKITFA